MRNYTFALAGVLLGTGLVASQQPAAQPRLQVPPAAALDPARNPLDAALVRWEQETKKITTLEASVTYTKIDYSFKTKDVYEGVAKFMKPNSFMFHVQKKDNPRDFLKVIYNGAFGYEYKAKKGEIYVYRVPTPKAGQPAEDNILTLIQGMKAEDAKRRFTLQLDNVADPNWIYVTIEPRSNEDKVEFQRAQLVLDKATLMPRRLWFLEPNQNQVVWELLQTKSPGIVGPADFAKPDTPGWKLVDAPTPSSSNTAVPPRVIRQTNP
jgi:TIGR03009 family protein